MSESVTVGTVRVQHGPWQRTGSSFLEGPPPHVEWNGQVGVIWGDAHHAIPLAVRDDDGCVAVIAGDLDAAWAEAEAALPEGCHVVLRGRALAGHLALDNIPRPGYRASVSLGNRTSVVDGGWSSTPAAALRALAAKLREAKG